MSALVERRIGIYEKALPPLTWHSLLDSVRTAGFDFLELSIDESAERLARLEWSSQQRAELVSASRACGVPIFSICLSGHRRIGLGSAHPDVRQMAVQMLDDAVGLAADLGVRVIQIAGYHAFYEGPDQQARARYVDGLRTGLHLACQRGVMLAVENIDTEDVASSQDALDLVRELDSPWFKIYPDAGNFAVHSLHVPDHVGAVLPHSVGLHLKDARAGEPRRVPFGMGQVPFDDVFDVLATSAYQGPLTIEMWNDDPTTATGEAASALIWIRDRLARADRRALSRANPEDGHLP